jgi:hypothetical protein
MDFMPVRQQPAISAFLPDESGVPGHPHFLLFLSPNLQDNVRRTHFLNHQIA